MRVLLVEDDPMIGSVIQSALRDASYAADWVTDGNAALTSLQAMSYALVLLDLNLPRVDGMSVLHTIRKTRNDIPVLVLTARETPEDRVAGLDGGADDYLVKPFAMIELLARMRALTRRKDGNASPVLSNGIVELDRATHEASREGISVRLTAREFSLLQALLTGRARSCRAPSSKITSMAGTRKSRAMRSNSSSMRCARNLAAT